MHAHDTLRTRRGLGDLGHGERRRVRREQGVEPGDAIELCEDLTLQIQLLEHGFDHEIAIRQVGQLRCQPETAERLVSLVLRETPLLDAARQVSLDRGTSALRELVAHLPPDRLEPGLDAHLCDACAHRPEPDNPDLPDLHQARASIQ